MGEKMNIEISIIIPVYNVDKYLGECLESLINQSFNHFEIICINDGSTDNSQYILEEYQKLDERIVIYTTKNSGAGAARNNGIRYAKGKYILFLDADDIFDKDLLCKVYENAEKNSSDIVAYNYIKFDQEGNNYYINGMRKQLLPTGIEKFNYRNCPNRIMSIVNPTPWNKCYRKEFIIENELKFEEISSSNDITFAAVSMAKANVISFVDNYLVKYRIGHEGTITNIKSKNLNNIIIAVSSAVEQAEKFEHYNEIKNAVKYFAVDNYVFGLLNYVKDFTAAQSKEYYDYIHKYFNQKLPDLDGEIINDSRLLREYRLINKYDYKEYVEIVSKRIIVSLTSYPARIKYVYKALESIFNQTKLPDLIVLWLAKNQFPNRERELPIEIHNLLAEGKLEVKWCDLDLKPHKKYFYSFKEYKNDLIITIDDDLLYSANMIENLYNSYLMYPDCVSACRAHLITFDKKILPYKYWVKEIDMDILTPSMSLFATGGAGTLYPVNLFSDKLLDEEAIIDCCLEADDLWMKIMELYNNIPVVIAQQYQNLVYIEGSQEQALCKQNVDNNQNDVQLNRIIEWTDLNIENNFVVNKLTKSSVGNGMFGVENVCKNYLKNIENLHRNYAKQRNEQKCKMGELRKQNEMLKSENERVKNEKEAEVEHIEKSISYRIGRFFTFIPRKIRRLRKKL